ncbi:MAG TPA: hypothetical protein VMB03_26930 [Bryobacteraceae bacterium]|nr:hypothetical protein [Bryobacteraceae bacterium]
MVTVPVEMLNAPVEAPDAMVSEAGEAKPGDALLVKVTSVPPEAAACETVTVHKVLWFERSVVNVQERPVTVAPAFSETAAVAVDPFAAAVRVAVWLAATVPVEILKAPVVAPAATVTDAGALNAPGALLVNVTTVPPVNAAFESVAVHVVLPLEPSVVEVHERPSKVGGVASDSVALAVVPFSVPVRVAV